MKNKIYLLLLFVVLAACRSDDLQDVEQRNAQLTKGLITKIISLNESKHKTRLLSELSNSKQMLSKPSLKNTLGKTVNYGDSISINTDHVVYIENGNYHNYIFKINRTNSQVNEPIENLLLTPLPDGSYKEYLIEYFITEQELQLFESGGWTIPQNKIGMRQLTSGTYNNGGLIQTLSLQNCQMVFVGSYYTWCSGNAHNNGEGADVCPATTKSQFVILYQEQCESIDEPPPPGSTPTVPGTPGDTPGGGDGTLCPDCPPTEPTECIQIPTDPTDPSTGIGENGCTPVLPIIPILTDPKPQTPCKNLKAAFADEKFKAKFDILTQPDIFNENHETAFVMKYPPIGTTGVAPAFISIDMPPCSTGDNDAVWPTNFAGITTIMHNHNNKDCNGNTPIKAPSPVDIRTFINKLLPQANTFTGSYTGAMSLVTTSGGNYMLMYEGANYPGSINAHQLKQLEKDYTKDFQDLYNRNDNVSQADIERLFTKLLKEKINKHGLNVYRDTATSAIKLEYDPTAPHSVKETNCQ